MKYTPFIFTAIISFLLTSCSYKPSIEELKKFAAVETYPEDGYLDTVSNKKALIIVAHDDDDCAMSGTIAKLKAEGWVIKQLSFVAHKLNDGSDGHPAGIICQGNELILEDGFYRLGLDTIKYPYIPILKEQMEKQFLRKKISKALLAEINDFKPSVIFTLDNEMGTYGHPEHIFISQLVLDLFKLKGTGVQRIYQSVYTKHMQKEIIDTWLFNKMKKYGYQNPTEIAKKMYNIDGMPEPTVQVNISQFAEQKMLYLMSYPEKARKNLRKFIPYYEEFDAQTYFAVFDREFYRVVEHELNNEN
ncbi:MAG: hypothetical protein B6I20_10810 [Bacteroidetes bacterium 4572_117]|nr:MAG: hypothetical protein B6I20_10810 [Bacteroidetes bacterium 4572_117]